jgi:cytochrome c
MEPTMRHSTLIITLIGSVLLASPPSHAADPAAGKQSFRSICSLCHDTAEGRNRVGPSLFGVVGRKSASVPGYSYSDANRNSGIVWTPEVLDRYLVAPQVVVPGTKMGYPGMKDDDKRHDLIAYLETLK